MTLAALVLLALPAFAAVPDEELGAAFQELRDSVVTRVVSPAPRVGPIGPASISRSSPQEPERSLCPKDYRNLSARPDPDLYSYVGYRYVRSDGSTCGQAPSDRILYLDPQRTTVSLPARPGEQLESAVYELAAPEYRLRRNFYFRTHLDGTRQYFSHDFREDTGRQVPETVVLQFPDRARFPLLPWEEPELFEISYGIESAASAAGIRTNYDYQESKSIERDAAGRLVTRIRFQPLKKKRLTPPDPEAVSLGLGALDRGLAIVIEDRWARYYQGEKLGLRLTLWEDVPLFPDRVMYEFDIELDVAARIVIRPEEDRWNGQRRHALQRGRRYYADWSFRRPASRISADTWIQTRRSDRFDY